MFGLLRGAVKATGEKAAIKDMERHIGFYRMAGEGEAALIRMSTAMAFLPIVSMIQKQGADFIREVMEGVRPLTTEESASLSTLISGISNASQSIAKKQDEKSSLLANGLNTWVLSFRAFVYPVLLPQVREMWQHIERGKANYEDVVLDCAELLGENAGSLWGFEPPPAFIPN